MKHLVHLGVLAGGLVLGASAAFAGPSHFRNRINSTVPIYWTGQLALRLKSALWRRLAIAAASAALICACTAGVQPAPPAPQGGPVAEWPNYGNDPGEMRYSPLDQINRGNVVQLEVAWTYHTGDVSDGARGRRKSAFENTPIVVDGTMYLSTPFNRVIALEFGPKHQLSRGSAS